MLRTERLGVIAARVAQDGSADVASLATELGVSGATIRRDLQSLHREQRLIRTHGGALAAETVDAIPLRVRVPPRHQLEKERIGRAGAAMVADGEVVGMSGGSTTLELARALTERRGITVVTNAINIAAELVGHPTIGLVVIGGVVRHSYELVGPAAESMLSKYNFDIGFIGVDGLTAEEGCTTYDEMEAQTDLAILRRSRRSVVVTDSSKIGRRTFARIATLSDVEDVVTDRRATPDQIAALEHAGVRVTTV